MIFIGILIVIATIWLLIKRYESRMVLFASGLAMATLAGSPLAAFDAFAKSMINTGLIQSICSVMGFAYVMKLTKCDQQLVHLLAKGLSKVRPILIPGAVLCTFAVNIALPSAAGCSAAVGAVFIPILIAAGIHPVIAAAAVLGGTFGSMLNPGNPHNPFVAKIAGAKTMDVIAVHATADIVAVLIGAAMLTIVAYLRKEHKGYVAAETAAAAEPGTAAAANLVVEKPNVLHAIVPVIPIVLLILGSSGAVAVLKKVDVPHAMLIGTLIGLAVTRYNPTSLTKAFFDGMGSAYGQILGIIIAAGTFVGGMTAIGLVKYFIDFLTHSTSIVKYAATFGPWALAAISGSGDAISFAFNEAVTPHAPSFGLSTIHVGAANVLAGALGRTMSPVSGACIICASLAGVSPMEVAKRNAPGMIIAVIVSMFLLF